MRFHVLTLLLVVVACGSLRGQTVDARAWVDSTNYIVGDPITVHVKVAHPKGLKFQPLLSDTANGFHVLERQPFRQTVDTVTSAQFVIAKYDSGRAIFPGIQLLYSRPGDTASHTVSTNPLLLTISTVAVDTTQEIKDVKPPLSVPWTFAEVALYLGILLILAAAGYFIYRYWKKKQTQQRGHVYVPPPRPAHIVALEELATLKEKKLWQQGLIKQYYSEATEIIRRYFENRYRFMALEQTTDEIMDDLRRHVQLPDLLNETEGLLRRADLVKFAKYQPDIPEHEEMFSGALSIVDRTKAIPRPVNELKEKEAANVGS